MLGQGTLSLSVAVVALVAVTVAVAARLRLGYARDTVVVTVRAVIQLLLVGVVIRIVFDTPALAPVYLTVMLSAAAFTSGRRLRRVPRAAAAAAASIAAGASTTGAVVFLSGALPFHAREVVPFTAQLIGGSMTATTLAGQRFIDDVGSTWELVEAWLVLGATPRQAVREMGRTAVARAVVPVMDQTRNVGLVVLPGSYVGLLLGGATPLEAGRVQLLVLIGLITASTVAAAVVTSLLSATLGSHKPAAVPR